MALLCRVWGADSVTWYHENMPVDSRLRHTILNDFTLTITGKFNCLL